MLCMSCAQCYFVPFVLGGVHSTVNKLGVVVKGVKQPLLHAALSGHAADGPASMRDCLFNLTALLGNVWTMFVSNLP